MHEEKPLYCPRCGGPVPLGFPDGLCPSCLVRLAPQHRSRTIGEYRLLRRIGRGSMARVYEAVHVLSGMHVALKLMRRSWCEDRRRFASELRAMAALDHPNVVPLYGGDIQNQRAYYTMRLIRGGTLAMRREEFERADAAAGLVAAIAHAVEHGPRARLIHCDLKPENILLDESGKPYLADLGIACHIDEVPNAGRIAGTPGSLAPELVEGRGARPETPSDIFSLGVILYELLSGERPFAGDSLEEYGRSLASSDIPPLDCKVPDDRNPILERIARKAMARDPAERYASAEALADDLKRCAARQRTSVHDKHPWQVRIEAIAAALDVRLVLLVAALVIFWAALGSPLALADSFGAGMVMPILAPVCAAMGFAQLITATGCDRHLVHYLLAPLRRVHWLVLPGGILAAYVVNVALPSQTGTAAALGPILVPLMLAHRYSPSVAGAAVILGASYGGELLSPAARDIQVVAGLVPGLSASALSEQVRNASIPGIAVATAVFVMLDYRRRVGRAWRSHLWRALRSWPARAWRALQCWPDVRTVLRGRRSSAAKDAGAPSLRASPVRACVPLVPVVLLLLAYHGWAPLAWLVETPDGPLDTGLPVVRAMLIGAVVAAVVGWREIRQHTRTFFDGMGFAYANIVSLTLAAKCFGDAIGATGLGSWLAQTAGAWSSLHVLSAGFSSTLGMLSGSGSGGILVYAQVVLAKLPVDAEMMRYAALDCLGGAFGRTASPVAAVVVYMSIQVGASPLALVRRLWPALAAGAAVSFFIAGR